MQVVNDLDNKGNPPPDMEFIMFPLDQHNFIALEGEEGELVHESSSHGTTDEYWHWGTDLNFVSEHLLGLHARYLHLM